MSRAGPLASTAQDLLAHISWHPAHVSRRAETAVGHERPVLCAEGMFFLQVKNNYPRAIWAAHIGVDPMGPATVWLPLLFPGRGLVSLLFFSVLRRFPFLLFPFPGSFAPSVPSPLVPSPLPPSPLPPFSPFPLLFFFLSHLCIKMPPFCGSSSDFSWFWCNLEIWLRGWVCSFGVLDSLVHRFFSSLQLVGDPCSSWRWLKHLQCWTDYITSLREHWVSNRWPAHVCRCGAPEFILQGAGVRKGPPPALREGLQGKYTKNLPWLFVFLSDLSLYLSLPEKPGLKIKFI